MAEEFKKMEKNILAKVRAEIHQAVGAVRAETPPWLAENNQEMRKVTTRLTGTESTLEAHMVACQDHSPAALRREVAREVQRAIASTGHPSQTPHACRAEFAVSEIKRMGQEFEPKFKELLIGKENLESEVKLTQGAIVTVQSSINGAKRNQQYQELQVQGVRGDIKRMEVKLNKVANSIVENMQRPLPSSCGVPPRTQGLEPCHAVPPAAAAAQGDVGPRCRADLPGERVSHSVPNPEVSPKQDTDPQVLALVKQTAFIAELLMKQARDQRPSEPPPAPLPTEARAPPSEHGKGANVFVFEE